MYSDEKLQQLRESSCALESPAHVATPHKSKTQREMDLAAPPIQGLGPGHCGKLRVGQLLAELKARGVGDVGGKQRVQLAARLKDRMAELSW